ncbi:nucleoside 2-deoxyribosyltransferase [Konateibacter massiliensis]|uniref:nucleoside 2-deoxyribosyltransferase n=1 Tax=Konateibacter massiliensis TaxID=2002841 RepID=UPI000C1515F4|nr:nucleoside 2-deoxyribosyltransferase [Konateibacter massiliensis]
MSKSIYLAGAMEIYEGTDVAREWRKQVEDYFLRDGIADIINPTRYYEYGRNYHKTDMEVFRFDLHKVRNADLILVNLADIRKSVGTCFEVYEAYRSGIPIIGFITDDVEGKELTKLIHPWIECCINRIETGEFALEEAMIHITKYYC